VRGEVMVFRGRYGYFNKYEISDSFSDHTRCLDSSCSYDSLLRLALYEGPKTAGRAIRTALEANELSNNQVFALVGNLPDQKREQILRFLKMQE